MMNKKGDNHFLSSEILGVVLAIFGIFILLLLGSKFYGLFDSKTEIEQAREHMKILNRTIENVRESGVSAEYLLTGPVGWALIAWPNDEFYHANNELGTLIEYGNTAPDECKYQNWEKCICLCPLESNDQLAKCNELSLCQDASNFSEISINSNKDDMRSFKLGIPNPTSLLISYKDNKLRITKA